jgi:hypothetical protein
LQEGEQDKIPLLQEGVRGCWINTAKLLFIVECS